MQEMIRNYIPNIIQDLQTYKSSREKAWKYIQKRQIMTETVLSIILVYFICFVFFIFLSEKFESIDKQKLEYYQKKYFEMDNQKYCQIISTVEASEISPDAGVQNGCYNNVMIECRICLEEYGPFIIPCKCDGTMKHVHEKCLKKWAAERLKRQVQSDEKKAKGKLSNIHGIQCELCKQNISMEVRKLKKLVGCRQAKQNSEEYFLPFVPLVIFNLSVFLGCLGGSVYIISFSLLLALFQDSIDYKNYSQNLLMICALLGLGFIFCSVFMVKSLIQLYYIFVLEEYEVIKVIPNPIVTVTSPKNTQADCPNTQWFGNLEPLSTPTSPHSARDKLLQSKLSLTRKKMSLKKQISRQIAQRKLSKLKQFKANDSKDVKNSQQKKDAVQATIQTSVTSMKGKGIRSEQ